MKSFGHQLGTAAKPWRSTFDADVDANRLTFVLGVHGVLEAIKHELENNHLESFSKLVRAETLADLLEQAEKLQDNGYYLAAGVIGRCVLEEHLRASCEGLACAPAKSKPTLNDYNMALYGIDHYAKTKMKQIDSLASVGNDAAHNKAELNKDDVRRLLDELPSVLESVGG